MAPRIVKESGVIFGTFCAIVRVIVNDECRKGVGGMDSIAHRIRMARVAAGLTQEELAKRLGRSKTYIVHLENGTRRVKADALQDIAAVTGTTVSALLGEEPTTPSPPDPLRLWVQDALDALRAQAQAQADLARAQAMAQENIARILRLLGGDDVSSRESASDGAGGAAVHA
jgi:transcriptional regulator with XRE-family HTH domain